MSDTKSQIFGLALVLILVQVSKKLNLEDPANLQILRASYATAQVVVGSLLYYIYTRIIAANDQTELKYTEKKAMSQEPQPEIVTTNKDYDISELKKQVQSTAIGVAILMFIHLKFNYVQPLFLQSILPIKTLLESKLAKVYLFGYEATGDLKRPWIAPSIFNMPAAEETPEPAAITEPAQPTSDKKKEKTKAK